MNKELFIKSIKELGIEPTEEQLNNLSIYADYLIEYNSHTNLTAIKDIEGIYLKHFYDSLTIVKAIDLNNINSLADIGTGAGFPGMVLKIMYPHLKVVLIDSNNKKITFLKNLVEKLGLVNIECLNIRCEEYAKENLDSFDLVTARAVSNMRILSELCLPLVSINGYFIPLKGNVEEELSIAKDLIKTLNGSIEQTTTFTLPIEKSTRNILKIKKIGPTPKGYPRLYDKMQKELKKLQK